MPGLPPKVSRSNEWVPEARWVEDGRIITAGGVAAGMDMALRLVERLAGTDMANLTAQYTEYEWHRDPGWDPFARQARLVFPLSP